MPVPTNETLSPRAAIGRADELALPNADRQRVMISLLRDEGVALFDAWVAKPDKIEY